MDGVSCIKVRWWPKQDLNPDEPTISSIRKNSASIPRRIHIRVDFEKCISSVEQPEADAGLERE